MLSLQLHERYGAPCALLLGGFDGLHLGHRVLLERAKRIGLPVGITTILGGKGKALFTGEERKFLFERAGIAFSVEIPFTEEVKNMPASEFLGALFGALDVRLAVCGEDYRFGKGAEGTTAMLQALAPCPVEVVPAVHTVTEGEGRILSTLSCKHFLERGELALLNASLSEDPSSRYFVQGAVEHGREEGRKYGFPTLNLHAPAGKLLPPEGVYGGAVATPKGEYPAIVNFGACPTFDVAERKIEAFLDGFSGDLYGETVRVYPEAFYRPIRKFASAEALKAQLQQDLARLRKSELR